MDRRMSQHHHADAEHQHPHPHDHAHDPHDHDHGHPTGVLGWLAAVLHWHGHDHDHTTMDPALHTHGEAIRTVWWALFLLGLTSVLQVGIVALSGSVALLADTAHNIGDTLNSIPLLVAFYLARRVATRRYTYGYGRAEDVAGVFIVLSIAVSAAIIFWESFQKLLNPQPMEHIPWVAAAALVGFVGNEAVAMLQIRVGRKISSEAMIADGLHARIDGLTSLAVLIAAGGAVIGLPILDPIIGLLIGVTILFITRDAARRIWYRLMDAVDPALVSQIEHTAGQVAGVDSVRQLRLRWVGHVLFAELVVTADETLTLVESDRIAQAVDRALRAANPFFSEISIRVEPGVRQANETPTGGSPALGILPPQYRLRTPSAAPMGAAALQYDADGQVAWNNIWTDFCDLALAGGPPHRGSLLEPVSADAIAADPDGYARVLAEIERGISMVTGLPVIQSAAPGWVGMVCASEEMAVWLLRAIVVENVSVRREDNVLYFPVGPAFKLEKEIKNVVTVVAKTTHYWQEHVAV